jgi:hypothetical protein
MDGPRDTHKAAEAIGGALRRPTIPGGFSVAFFD